MKKHERVTLHREKLYQEVWQTPISQLASKYGLSDVGLAKVCKRMDIPLPPRGYWQKRRYGHEVKESNLPAARKQQAQAETQINKSEEDLLHIARNKQSKSKLGHVERQRVFRLQAALKNWESSNRIRAFIAAMRAAPRPPVWINLEYLSAEDWVGGCHGLPSPHPSLPLRKHFFFPGFRDNTGGVLGEADVSARREAQLADPAAGWAALGLTPPLAGELTVSLFCYGGERVDAWLDALLAHGEPVRVLVPDGRGAAEAAHWCGQWLAPGWQGQRGAVRVQGLPFVEQHLLTQADAEFNDIYSAAQALRFHGEEEQRIDRALPAQIYCRRDRPHLRA